MIGPRVTLVVALFVLGGFAAVRAPEDALGPALGAGHWRVALASAAGGPPLVAAHRGGAQLWPENSLLAFRNALALGVDFLETDVHVTADGEVVILHDPTAWRSSVRGRTNSGCSPMACMWAAQSCTWYK